MNLVDDIKKLAEEKLASPSHFIVDVKAAIRKGPQKVLILVDGDNGVTIDDCANLSREVAAVLDEKGWLNESYLLEVSTPGLDQPLALLRQYKKNIGRGLKVKLADQSQQEGKLSEVTDEHIVLQQETGSGKKKESKTITLPF